MQAIFLYYKGEKQAFALRSNGKAHLRRLPRKALELAQDDAAGGGRCSALLGRLEAQLPIKAAYAISVHPQSLSLTMLSAFTDD